MKIKSFLAYQSLAIAILAAVAMFWTLSLPGPAHAQAIYQSSGVIDSGTTIAVRTNETINAKNSDGRVFSGVVEEDVIGRNGRVVIPRGSTAELVVRSVGNNDIAVDLDSINVTGTRYSVDTAGSVVSSDEKEGFGVNKRTGTFVGGGAALGAIIGAIAGGGKGAAIGAGVGAASGAGAQILTKGKSVNVPAESLLTFQLAQPLQAGIADSGYMRNGAHYHRGYANQQSAAYREGLRHGRADADRNLPWNTRTSQWNRTQDRSDYQAGYSDGYNEHSQAAYNRQKPGYYGNGRGYYGNGGGNISVGADNNVTWQGPENSTVYVQMDNQPLQPFASGQSGVQNAYWINPGHVYTFILKDAYGNEIARQQVDMRNSYQNRRR